MKKFLISSIAFVIISLAEAANISAASVGSQSIDVTVGEVDEISPSAENQDVRTPDTGLFGLETDGAAIAVAATASTIVILACISGYIYRKHTK